jgi:hypothetical protein
MLASKAVCMAAYISFVSTELSSPSLFRLVDGLGPNALNKLAFIFEAGDRLFEGVSFLVELGAGDRLFEGVSFLVELGVVTNFFWGDNFYLATVLASAGYSAGYSSMEDIFKVEL